MLGLFEIRRFDGVRLASRDLGGRGLGFRFGGTFGNKGYTLNPKSLAHYLTSQQLNFNFGVSFFSVHKIITIIKKILIILIIIIIQRSS